MSLIDSINQITPSTVRAVCFDLGGVLVQINRTWEDVLFAAGIRSNIVGSVATLPELRQLEVGAITEDEYYEGLKNHLHLPSPEEAAKVHKLILKDPYPGTMELIEELHANGILTGCISNTSGPHLQEMMESGRFNNVASLQHHVASQQVGLEKPDPAIFQAFEDLTGTLPHEIVFFDDTEDHVEAAREKGWRAHWIDHNADTAEQMELLLIAEGALSMPKT